LRVTLHLDEEDLARFHAAMERASLRAEGVDASDILDGAKYALDHLPIASAPGYVRARMVDVQRLILMLEDEDWMLPDALRIPALRALAYFGDPEDLVHDHTSVIGLLDDAIVLDLMTRGLRGALRAFDQFSAFRSTQSDRRSAPGANRSSEERSECARELAECRRRLLGRLRSPGRTKVGQAN